MPDDESTTTLTPAVLELVKTDVEVPPPDDLIAGNLGAVHMDIIKFFGVGIFKRGTLLMSGTDGYVPAGKSGITNGKALCILANNVTLAESEYVEIAAYFSGDFNEERVIFPFETEEDTHADLVELVREPLRQHKIFLRPLHQ